MCSLNKLPRSDDFRVDLLTVAEPALADALHKLLDDPAAEVTRYRLKVSFLSVMLLHEDPAATPGDALDPGQTSAEKLRVIAEQYFGRVQGIQTSGIGPELNKIRDQFTAACPLDHLRLVGRKEWCLWQVVALRFNWNHGITNSCPGPTSHVLPHLIFQLLGKTCESGVQPEDVRVNVQHDGGRERGAGGAGGVRVR